MALSLLRNYESDSDKDSGYTSEEEKKRKGNFVNSQERKKKIRKYDDEDDDMLMDCNEPVLELCRSKKLDQSSKTELNSKNRIPLPPEFCLQTNKSIDNQTLHQGRVRSFPHEKGNWASLLYIPILFEIYEPHLKSMVSALIAASQEPTLNFIGSSELHVSLSRTLILRLHWIQPLLEDFRKKISGLPKFSMWLHGLAVYSNEEKTRTFLGVKVHQGKREMLEIVKFVNASLDEYQLPTFYEDCSFHMSLAWCTGNKKEELTKLLPQFEGICSHYFDIESDMRTFDVDELLFKTGNRIHRILLKS